MVPERLSRRVIKRHRMCMRARIPGSPAYLRANTRSSHALLRKRGIEEADERAMATKMIEIS